MGKKGRGWGRRTFSLLRKIIKSGENKNEKTIFVMGGKFKILKEINTCNDNL